jgi:hypothetical protein
MDDLDILTLAEAAEELGLAPVTLRAQAARGVLRTRLIGKTYITTRDELERYRREHLGQRGPRGLSGTASHPVPRITSARTIAPPKGR